MKIITTTHRTRTLHKLEKIALTGLLALTFAGFEAPAHAATLIQNGTFTATSGTFGSAGGGINTGSDYNTGGNLTNWTVVDVGSSAGIAFLYDSGPQGGSTANQGIGLTGRSNSNNSFALWDPNNSGGGSPTGGAIPNSSPGGGNFIVADGGSSYNIAMYQTLTGLTAGKVYSLSFYYAAGQQTAQSGATQDFWQVSFGNSDILTEGGSATGTTVVDTPTISLASEGFSGWLQETINFTAGSNATQYLTFLSEGTPNSLPPMDLLSDVTLTPAPEPASLGVFGAGMVSLIALLWFRKNQVRKAAASSDSN